MKKIFLLLALTLGFTSIFAKTWTIQTTCGTTEKKEIADDVTLDMVKSAISQANYNECGIKPKFITITY